MQLQDIFSNLMELLSYDATAPMIFSSGLFWFLFILFMPIYAVLKNRRWQMLVFVVAFSLYFYYKSSGLFFLLLVCTSLLDWGLSRLLVKLKSKGAKKACVAISIITSLSILGYFKYANFFMWNITQMIEGNFQKFCINTI